MKSIGELCLIQTRQLNAQKVSVQKQQSSECLIVGRYGNPLLGGEHGQKLSYLR